MNTIEDFQRRGLLDNFSDESKVKELFDSKATIYCGFDPSFKSLQLGNFIMITILQRLQKAGHRVIAMLGGATGMIGDPSGKNSERKFLSTDQVLENAECIKRQLEKYIDTSDPNKGLIINNYDWWKNTDSISFLREYGKNFQVGYMLAKDVVKSRLEVGISYAEFSYMILQAGDFDHLYREYGCKMQFGGGDQWGNLTTSLDFVKKKEGNDCGAEVFSFKLITDSQGKKFGKSENGALYLDPELTTPYDIYQYFVNVSDTDVKKYLYIFDDRPIEEIDKIYASHMERPELRTGQKELAKTIVSKLHGVDKALECVKMSEALFKDDFSSLSLEALTSLTKDLNVIDCQQSISLLDALTSTGLASSKREGREFIKNSACKINGQKCVDLERVLTPNDALYNKYIFIKRGKKLYAVVRF